MPIEELKPTSATGELEPELADELLPARAGMSRRAAIARAKLEWEGTVDALASLVCLLDRDGKIMRTNRVVEDWSLGTVHEVIGLDTHTLLHRDCKNPACDVDAFLRKSLRALLSGTRLPSELRTELGLRNLSLNLRPLRVPIGDRTHKVDTFAVLIANDVTALNRAQTALQQLNITLEGRVRSRTKALDELNLDLRNEISRREQAEQQLRKSGDELAALSAQLIRAQEDERKRISQELHDSVGQSLSAAKYTVERGLELLRVPDRAGSMAALALAVSRIQEAAESIRTISMDLRPTILDDLGVVSALQWFCRSFAEIYPSLEVTEDFQVKNHEVPDRLATVIYRCAQEMLHNVAKHAQATRVEVSLTMVDKALDFQVRDNGKGIVHADPVSTHRGSGLRNLRERAKMTGGEFHVDKSEDGGTIAHFTWPLMSRDRIRRSSPVAKR
ncbi:MAG: histidine kinase [Pseudomonadota bacterium]